MHNFYDEREYLAGEGRAAEQMLADSAFDPPGVCALTRETKKLYTPSCDHEVELAVDNAFDPSQNLVYRLIHREVVEYYFDLSKFY
jgi:hypothetical protein